jgi:hypothetical protein
VLDDIARDAFHIAMTNRRLVALGSTQISFHYKDQKGRSPQSLYPDWPGGP